MGIFNRFIEHLTHAKIEPEVASDSLINEQVIEHFTNYTNLMQLQDSRQLLEVLIPGHRNSFQSMIIGIDFLHRTFSLDEFSPQLTPTEALTNQWVTVRHQHHWKVLSIHTQISHWSVDDQCYHLHLPDSVDYQPRRHHQRLLLSNDSLLNTHINPLYGAPWYAKVKDISLGGMRVTISGDLRPHLHKDKILPKCQVILDNKLSIQCRGHVKSFHYDSKPSRHTNVSIEFEGMIAKHRADLTRFIEYVNVAA